MAKKAWLSKTYTLVVIPHAEAKFRKIKVPYWVFFLGAIASSVIITAIAIFAVHYWLMVDDVSRLTELAQDNQRLQKENARFEQLTSNIMHRLDLIEDRAKVLITMAGVKPVEPRGLGDISGMEERFNNELLDRELPLKNLRLNELSENLEKVEKNFNEMQEELDYTPSIWPLYSTELGHISSKRGYRPDPITKKRTFHRGIDVSANMGTPIVAPANGVVLQVQEIRGLGKIITVDHGRGYITRYGHMSRFNVKKGDAVKRYDIIGFVGNTGKSTAPHLHYEVHYNGKDTDPLNFILKDQKVSDWDFKSVSNNR